MNKKREWIALYRVQNEWRLITREVATLEHAKKMRDRYAKSYKTRLVYVGDDDLLNQEF